MMTRLELLVNKMSQAISLLLFRQIAHTLKIISQTPKTFCHNIFICNHFIIISTRGMNE